MNAYPVTKVEVTLSESPKLVLTVYGKAKALTREDRMEQAYFVCTGESPARLDPTPRCNLTKEQRKLVKAYLEKNYPEHAAI